jgi:hypothetical protein
LSVLDAERPLYESQDAAVQSERAATLDLVALYKALGGGCEEVQHGGRRGDDGFQVIGCSEGAVRRRRR